MPIYEIQTLLTDRASGAQLESLIAHAIQLGGVISAASVALGRIRLTINPALPTTQLAHLSATTILG